MAVITSPVTGVSVTVLNVDDVMGLLYKDLVALYADADIQLDFQELDRSYGEWGALIEDMRVPAAASHEVDPDATDICGPYYFNVDGAYYQTWKEKCFSSEVRRVEITKIVRGEEDYAALLSRIVNRNLQGYYDETNQAIEQAFAKVEDGAAASDPAAMLHILNNSGSLSVVPFTPSISNPAEGVGSYLFTSGKKRLSSIGCSIDSSTGAITVTGAATYPEILAEILFRAKNMTRANATYTEGSYRYGASIDDLVIYVSDRFQASMDIKYIQTLFNERGLDKLPEIRTYQGIADANVGLDVAFIIDKRTLNHVTRYFEASVGDIRCRKSTMFDLHVEDMVKYVPFYKAWGVIFTTPNNEALAVTVTNSDPISVTFPTEAPLSVNVENTTPIEVTVENASAIGVTVENASAIDVNVTNDAQNPVPVSGGGGGETEGVLL